MTEKQMNTIIRKARRQVAKAVLRTGDAIAGRIASERMRNDVNTAAGRLWHALLPPDPAVTARPVEALRLPTPNRRIALKATAKLGRGILNLTPRHARDSVSDLLAQVQYRIAGTWDCEHLQWVTLRTPAFATFRGCPNCWEGIYTCRQGCASERGENDCDCDFGALVDPARAINVRSCKHDLTQVYKIPPGIYYGERCTRCNAKASHRDHCAFKEGGEECDCKIRGWMA